MRINNISCLGFGDRVVKDIMPILFRVFPSERINFYSLSERKQNYKGKIIKSKSIDEFFSVFDESQINLIVICVTNNALLSIVQKLHSFDLKNTHILIDTPIKEVECLESLQASSIRILEDFPPSPVGSFVDHLVLKGVRLIIFYKSFYKYHGYSILRRISKVMSEPTITKIFALNFIQLYKIGSKFILVLGARNYEKARICGVNFSQFYSDRSLYLKCDLDSMRLLYKHKIIATYDSHNIDARCFPALDDVEFCKQIGLYRIFKNLDVGENAFDLHTTPEQAVCDYINTL
jgi:hypothetical protein